MTKPTEAEILDTLIYGDVTTLPPVQASRLPRLHKKLLGEMADNLNGLSTDDPPGDFVAAVARHLPAPIRKEIYAFLQLMAEHGAECFRDMLAWPVDRPSPLEQFEQWALLAKGTDTPTEP
jgi:hypothetical protein